MQMTWTKRVSPLLSEASPSSEASTTEQDCGPDSMPEATLCYAEAEHGFEVFEEICW